MRITNNAQWLGVLLAMAAGSGFAGACFSGGSSTTSGSSAEPGRNTDAGQGGNPSGQTNNSGKSPQATAPDAAPPPQQAVGVYGTMCSRNADCPTGICLPLDNGVNRCTTECNTTGDCLTGWTCDPLLGQDSNICQCSPLAEACNSADDDCNGIVDDQAAVNDSCSALQSVPHECQQGSCVCLSPCSDGTCPDLSSDSANCGACGNACDADQACVAGECECLDEKTLCDGTCSDVSVDLANCGVCGQVCTGTCALGHCRTTLPMPEGNSLAGFAADDTTLYVAMWGIQEGYTVFRVPLDGSLAIPVATGTRCPRALTVHAGEAYWIESLEAASDECRSGLAGADGNIIKSNPGGAPIVLTDDFQSPCDLAFDATHMYWTNSLGGQLGVMKAPLSGGDAVPLAPRYMGACTIAVGASEVYWLDDRGLMRVGLDGLGEMEIEDGAVIQGGGVLKTLAVDDVNAYGWQPLGPPLGQTTNVVRVPLNGDPAVSLYDTGTQVAWSSIVADGNHVYWLHPMGGAAPSTTVLRAPIGGGPPETIATVPGFEQLLAATATHIFTRSGGVDSAPGSGIVVISK